jgi:hypothetical protein
MTIPSPTETKKEFPMAGREVVAADTVLAEEVQPALTLTEEEEEAEVFVADTRGASMMTLIYIKANALEIS